MQYRTFPGRAAFLASLLALLIVCACGSGPGRHGDRTTREVTVRVGGSSRTFTLADLQALPRVIIADHEVIGVKKGPLGKDTWAGASLKDLLLKVDPASADSSNAGKLIVVTSSDGWVAVIKWAELFGSLRGGELLYNVKGCNECHGVNAEGSAPGGKRQAPPLAGKKWDFNAVRTRMRTGRDAHAGANPYTEAQLSDFDLQAIFDWVENPDAPAPIDAFAIDSARSVSLLAFERNGKPMSGEDGLIQLIIGWDEFAGRYSHWVSTIELK